MSDLKLSGCGTALVTPFRGEEVDYDAYRTLLKRQTDAGVNFLVPLGTTAETPCLDDVEKLRLLEITRECSCGLPLLVGAGTNSLRQTIRNIRTLSPLGADAFLVVVPYYNKPTQEGMYQYFKAVAEASDKPVVLYNVPGRTGSNLLPETTLKLAAIPNIIGIKEASGNYAQISTIIKHAPEGFSVLSGNDDETLSLMATGADGVISVASNIAPVQMVALTSALAAGDIAKARDLHHQLSDLFHNCFVESNPIPVKAGLAAMGLMEDSLRLPLCAATAKTSALMTETVKALSLI